MGTALGIALSKCGFRILSVVSRNPASAQKTAKLIEVETSRLPVAVDLRMIPSDQIGDVLVLTTSDDVIARIVVLLAERFSHTVDRKGKRHVRVALHTSGVLSSETLLPLREYNFSTGSLHPLVSVVKTTEGAAGLRGAYYCLEGEPKAVDTAKEIVAALGGTFSVIEPHQKALYHAAAVMAAGHLTVLLNQAQEMLTHCGIEETVALAMLLSLSSSVLENLKTEDPTRALTGPFVRGDFATIKKHIEALEEEGMSQVLETYLALGRGALLIAEQSGLARESVTQLKSLLNDAD